MVRSRCRHHHHLKQHPHWTAHTRPDGRIDWRHRHERRGPRPTPGPGPARPDHPADRSRAAIAASHNPSGIPTGAESSTSSGMSRNEARYSSAHIHGGPVPGPSKAPPTRLPSRGRSSGTAQASLTRSSSRISHPPRTSEPMFEVYRKMLLRNRLGQRKHERFAALRSRAMFTANGRLSHSRGSWRR